MTAAVIEVHRVDAGYWEAFEIHVLSGEDLQVVSLDGLASCQALVRIGGSLKQITVYKEDDDEGFITFTEAYGM